MDEREFARWLDKHRDKGDFSYVKFPSVLFRSPMYRCLSAEAILIYALMRDRLSLSEKNKMQDETAEDTKDETQQQSEATNEPTLFSPERPSWKSPDVASPRLHKSSKSW